MGSSVLLKVRMGLKSFSQLRDTFIWKSSSLPPLSARLLTSRYTPPESGDRRTGGRIDGQQTDRRTGGRTDGQQTDRRTGGWTDGQQTDRRTGGWTDGQQTNRRIGGRTDGQQTDRRTGGWTDGQQTDRRTGGWTDGQQTDRRTGGWTDGQQTDRRTGGWTDGQQTDRRTGGWTDGQQTNRRISGRTDGQQTDRRTGGRTDGQQTDRRTGGWREEEDLWDGAVKVRGQRDSLYQRPSFTRSVFAAGTAKRTSERQRRTTAAVFAEDEEEYGGEDDRRSSRGAARLQPPDRPLAAAEWRTLRESVGSPPHFDTRMLSTLMKSGVELDIAKSLLSFVATETGTLPYKVLLCYLTLCERGSHYAEVFDLYDIMRASFPVLETSAFTLFIKSFSRTDRWREAVSILQELNKVFTPSSRNYGDVIAAAASNGDWTLAWSLYGELFEKGLSPHQETWEALFKGRRETKEDEGKESENMSQSEQTERLLGILLYMRNNQVYPQLSLASTIKTWFERGVCLCCGSKLESIQLTAEEYQQLKHRVMTDIIQERDVFKKTTPEELERFKAFVKRKPAFDVVVDGLNVANARADKRRQSEMLLAVVSELEAQGLIVLVLGRKHMLRPSASWNRHNMNLIQQKAHCFFTENISEDDPFLLYATLHSGNQCRFVSMDLMRDHKACLPDEATRRLFFKWQRGHQLVLDGSVATGRIVRFKNIPGYDTIIQTSEDSWHLPYDDSEDRSSYEVPQRWLCLNMKR